jgi:hypothetical protein
MIGKLMAAPVRLLNTPARTVEKMVGDDDQRDRVLSQPLESLAESVEEAVDGEDEKGGV